MSRALPDSVLARAERLAKWVSDQIHERNKRRIVRSRIRFDEAMNEARRREEEQ